MRILQCVGLMASFSLATFGLPGLSAQEPLAGASAQQAKAAVDSPLTLLPEQVVAVVLVRDIESFEKELSYVAKAIDPEAAGMMNANVLTQLFLETDIPVDKSKSMVIGMLPMATQDSQPQFVFVIPFTDAEEAAGEIEALGLPGPVVRRGSYVACAPLGGDFKLAKASPLASDFGTADVCIRGNVQALLAPFAESLDVFMLMFEQIMDQQTKSAVEQPFIDAYIQFIKDLRVSAETMNLTFNLSGDNMDWRTHLKMKAGSRLAKSKAFRSGPELMKLSHPLDPSHSLKVIGEIDFGTLIGPMMDGVAREAELGMVDESDETKAEIRDALKKIKDINLKMHPRFAMSMSFDEINGGMVAVTSVEDAKKVLDYTIENLRGPLLKLQGIEALGLEPKEESGNYWQTVVLDWNVSKTLEYMKRSMGDEAFPLTEEQLAKSFSAVFGGEGPYTMRWGARDTEMVTAFGGGEAWFINTMNSLKSKGTASSMKAALANAIPNPGLLIDIELRAFIGEMMSLTERLEAPGLPPVPEGTSPIPLSMSFGFQEATASMGLHINLVQAIKFFKAMSR